MRGGEGFPGWNLFLFISFNIVFTSSAGQFVWEGRLTEVLLLSVHPVLVSHGGLGLLPSQIVGLAWPGAVVFIISVGGGGGGAPEPYLPPHTPVLDNSLITDLNGITLTDLVNDCLGDVDSSVCSCLGLHATLPRPLPPLLPPLLTSLLTPRNFPAEQRTEVEHVRGAVEGGLEEATVQV